jgi:hypothetical protein
MKRLAITNIDVIYDCILRATRYASADYVNEEDGDYLCDVKDAAENLLNSLESIEVKSEEE